MVHRILNMDSLKGGGSAFLFGPRGVGKTYLCRDYIQQFPLVHKVELLNYEVYSRYLRQPDLFRKEIENKLVEEKPLLVLIDEVQKLPSLLDEVHYLIETYKNKVNFILTGSSARKLKRGGANLLAGRAWSLKLHPLTHREVKIDLEKALVHGTLPAIYLDDKFPARTLKAYVETYLKEEIFQEALVRRVEGFSRFIEIAGQMNSEPVNFTKIARGCGVSDHTVQEYYSILLDTLLVFRLDPWHHSVRKQIAQAPKFYFFDCGVLNAIRRELNVELNVQSYRYGNLFETFIVQELIRLNDYLETDYQFHYWRTNTGLEVDVVLSRGAKEPVIAIEIKSNHSPMEQDLSALRSFKSENENAILVCFSNTPEAYSLGDIMIYPWQEGIKSVLG